MKIVLIIIVLTLLSCSDSPEQETKKSVVESEVTKKPPKKDHLLKGYQDNLQKAKDMEKEVLKAAERKKKAIDDASK